MFHNCNGNKTVYFFLVLLKYRENIKVKTVTLYKKLYFFSLKVFKARKGNWHYICFIISVEKSGWAIQKNLFA